MQGYGRSMAALFGVIGVIALEPPSPASAATMAGETFAPTASCLNDSTWIQSPGGSGAGYAAPFRGVITAWRYQAGNDPPDALKLKVARPQGGNDFTFIGESAATTPTASVLNAYTGILIPVRTGDVIGLHVSTDPAGDQCGRVLTPGYAAHGRMGDFPPGTTTDMGGALADFQLDISATLEPDIDCDGLGDETQDPSVTPPGDCPQAPPQPEAKVARSLKLDASKNKVKRGREVTLTGQLTEILRQACQSGQTIELQRKKPSQASFAAVEQLQTDAQGSFTTKEKVRKTYEYRAQVSETAACLGQVSDTQKVKVKKPK